MIRTINYFILLLIISKILSISVFNLLALDPEVIDYNSSLNYNLSLFIVITALPIVETLAGDLSGYIPTNIYRRIYSLKLSMWEVQSLE